jgi:hypothetical protein
MSVHYGTPLFTDGVFGLRSAQDDLGLEEVGAGLLRRLIPGVVQNTPNAGYYAFYPYLLWKWEQLGGDIRRDVFIPFYRRQEAAYALACTLHPHRGGVSPVGINGAIAARESAASVRGGAADVNLTALADRYMDTPLGGYGLFYAASLQDARLVRRGESGVVDRVTEHGAAVAQAFAKTFETTRYFIEFLKADVVPADVIRELGDSTCLCTIPGRTDDKLLLDTFFGTELERPAWEDRRQMRVGSLSLLLEFHDQRPADAEDQLAAWRRALLEPRFSDGTQWSTTHQERRQSWRAYQLREVSVLVLTSIWSMYLALLAERHRATHLELATQMKSWLRFDLLGYDPQLSFESAKAAAWELVATPYDLGREVEPLISEWHDERERAFCRCLRCLAVLPREIARTAVGFTELLNEGGSHRWSLNYLNSWLQARADQSVTIVADDLLSALYHQHVRVALSKVRVPNAQNLRAYKGSWRDPFNFAEDDGVLRPLRPDEPFWTGARYNVGNQLLWTLGLLSSPTPPISLTDLGREYLSMYADA